MTARWRSARVAATAAAPGPGSRVQAAGHRVPGSAWSRRTGRCKPAGSGSCRAGHAAVGIQARRSDVQLIFFSNWSGGAETAGVGIRPVRPSPNRSAPASRSVTKTRSSGPCRVKSVVGCPVVVLAVGLLQRQAGRQRAARGGIRQVEVADLARASQCGTWSASSARLGRVAGHLPFLGRGPALTHRRSSRGGLLNVHRWAPMINTYRRRRRRPRYASASGIRIRTIPDRRSPGGAMVYVGGREP